ncbi:hypothetical protein DFQ05_0908 [Winogradskyella wandonensis]|uniref:LTXXQ motif family protein n=1 Tax=Winogradskyella wandonensis TaxID=1442586 RepID=A0A4R1KXP8_9FLAO|nr:hypothetical protein [Winogradskyella wandonensis]TCK69387.1 hypothetical protein DFQ05_0908 [Winogradskyella wandonensis]
MRKLILLLSLILASNIAEAQFGGQRQNRFNRQPRTSTEPTDTQKEKFKNDMKEKQQEFISKFLLKLDADEFQQEIVKITLTEYFEKLILFNQKTFERQIGKDDALKKMQDEHFADLRSLMSKSDMKKIDDLIEGKNLKELDKEERKKKKRKKRKKEEKEDSKNND